MHVGIPFEVEYQDRAPERGTVRIKDMVACEVQFQRSLLNCHRSAGITTRLWLAWSSLARARGSIGGFEDWLAGVTAYRDLSPPRSEEESGHEFEEEEEEPDPSPTGPGSVTRFVVRMGLAIGVAPPLLLQAPAEVLDAAVESLWEQAAEAESLERRENLKRRWAQVSEVAL